MELSSWVDSAIAGLSASKLRIADAPSIVPARPGLYAIYGEPSVWAMLNVVSTEKGGPLYVGKSEDDLLDREVFTHFNASSGRLPATGSSTVRRSFAALLRTKLGLQSQARNPSNPGHFANYGLKGDGDRKLTAWMAQHLELSIWEKPQNLSIPLKTIETVIIRHWDPPINIHKAPTGRRELKAARAALALEARANAIAFTQQSAITSSLPES